MIELGQLEKHHEEFARRGVRIVAVSQETQDDAAETQGRFPHLTFVADIDHTLISAVGVLHEKAKPDGGDAAAPTTILIDGNGVVRWLFRPDLVLTRLSPEDLLKAIDGNLR
jgi:peroxiredoxin